LLHVTLNGNAAWVALHSIKAKAKVDVERLRPIPILCVGTMQFPKYLDQLGQKLFFKADL